MRRKNPEHSHARNAIPVTETRDRSFHPHLGPARALAPGPPPSTPFRLILVRLNGMELRRSSRLKALANPADNSRAVRGTASQRKRAANDPSTRTVDTALALSRLKCLANLADSSRAV
jgi:hypothetical protein